MGRGQTRRPASHHREPSAPTHPPTHPRPEGTPAPTAATGSLPFPPAFHSPAPERDRGGGRAPNRRRGAAARAAPAKPTGPAPAAPLLPTSAAQQPPRVRLWRQRRAVRWPVTAISWAGAKLRRGVEGELLREAGVRGPAPAWWLSVFLRGTLRLVGAWEVSACLLGC